MAIAAIPVATYTFIIPLSESLGTVQLPKATEDANIYRHGTAVAMGPI